MLESRLFCIAVQLHLVPISSRSTLLSINYVIISLYIRHHVVKQNEKQCCRCQTESKTIVKENVAKFLLQRTAGWHRHGLGSFNMEIIVYKGRPFSVFVDRFVAHFALLQLYSNYLVLPFSKHRGRNEW